MPLAMSQKKAASCEAAFFCNQRENLRSYLIPKLLLFLFGDLTTGLRFAGFGVAVADHVEAHEVGGAGFGTGSGDDADDLTRMDVALSFEYIFSHLDELVGVVEALAEDRVGAPEKHAAVDDLLEGRESEDGWVRVVLREEADGGAGLG